MQEIVVDSRLVHKNRYRFRVLAQSVGKTPSRGLLGAGAGAGFGVAFAVRIFVIVIIYVSTY